MWRHKERFRKRGISKAEKLYYTALIGYTWYEAPFNLIYSSSMGSIKAAIKNCLIVDILSMKKLLKMGDIKKFIQ